MEELFYELEDFLPLDIGSPMKEYLGHHTRALFQCIERKLYSSSYYHLHLIYMALIYIQVERILNNVDTKERDASLIGFAGNEDDLYVKEDNVKEDGSIERVRISANSLSVLKEKTIFRFFRLVTKDKEIISKTSCLVDVRNRLFHARPGEIISENNFQRKFKEYIKALKKIVQGSLEFIKRVYEETLSRLDEDTELIRDEVCSYFSNFSKYELKFLIKKYPKIKASKEISRILSEDL